MSLLRYLIHVLTIEIGNLIVVFFEFPGLELATTNPVLANVHVGFGLLGARWSVQSPFTAGTAHPQQILAGVSLFRGSSSVFAGGSAAGGHHDVRAYRVESMGLRLAQRRVHSLGVIGAYAQAAPGGLWVGDMCETDSTEGLFPQ